MTRALSPGFFAWIVALAAAGDAATAGVAAAAGVAAGVAVAGVVVVVAPAAAAPAAPVVAAADVGLPKTLDAAAGTVVEVVVEDEAGVAFAMDC